MTSSSDQETSSETNHVGLGEAPASWPTRTGWILLAVGLLIGLLIFAPKQIYLSLSGLLTGVPTGPFELFASGELMSRTMQGMLIGLSLPAPLLHRWRSRRRWGLGSWVWLMLGIGSWLMLPAAVAGRCFLATVRNSIDLREASQNCLHLSVPFICLWLVLALLVAGQLRPAAFSRRIPWQDRFGLALALAWCPWGLWELAAHYLEVFQ